MSGDDQTKSFDTVFEGADSKYEKLKLLGKGSFGQAWLVRRRSDKAQLVAKVMDLGAMSTKDQKYVEAEIQCLAACNHFAVIRYVEDFVHDSQMLIVMEYADAGDLSMQIKARAADGQYFQEHEVGYTFIQLCMAVDHVHRNKMLHRDIKSANVLLMSSGLIKLGDFGFSHQYDDTVSGAVAKTFCGTPYYLAPELWRRQRYSKKADVWAMGILLYEMMALKRPFQGQGMKPLMENVLRGNFEPLPAHYSPELCDLCHSMLAADPNRRPSIAELFQTPCMRRILSDFDKSSGASPLIDADTKTLMARNLQEAKDIRTDDAKAGNTCGRVGQINEDVEYEGQIRKESNGVWKERYFRLSKGDLIISVRREDTETKSISVTQLSSVVPVPYQVAKADGVFALNTEDDKTMWMQAPSNEERQTWVHRIQQAMGIA